MRSFTRNTKIPFVIILFSLWISESIFDITAYAQVTGTTDNNDKHLVLFDKILHPFTNSFITERAIRSAAEAKFNTYCLVTHESIKGDTRLQLIKQTALFCEKYNLSCLPAERLSFRANTLDRRNGKWITWKNGTAEPILSPNTNDFWEHLERKILPIVSLSTTNKSIIGVFVDFENYFFKNKKPGNYYPVSYDPYSLRAFQKEKQLPIEEIPYGKTSSWLIENDFDNAFISWQKRLWVQKSVVFRKKIDRINPKFRFFIYPGRTPFLTEAVYNNWGTEQAPIVLAYAGVQSRKTKYMTWPESIEYSIKNLREAEDKARLHNMCGQFISGLYTSNQSWSEEGLSRIAQVIANQTDGYWFFYQRFKNSPYQHKTLWNAFTKANQEIHAGNTAYRDAPFKNLDRWAADTLNQFRNFKAQDAPIKELDNRYRDYSNTTLINANIFAIKAKKNDVVRITISGKHKGSSPYYLDYQIINHTNTIPLESKTVNTQSHNILFTVPEDGLYWLCLNSYYKQYTISESNTPLALLAIGESSAFHGPISLYYIPKNLNPQFECKIQYLNTNRHLDYRVNGYPMEHLNTKSHAKTMNISTPISEQNRSKLLNLTISGHNHADFNLTIPNRRIPSFWFLAHDDVSFDTTDY
ncbi:hypothetical protein [Poriferisphaera sp. WC338]|uniref:hypothetical protein n=1 Tax=Poriferisphaera sp. WC338 TaxID=3425129 RepID=UPI003D8128FE